MTQSFLKDGLRATIESLSSLGKIDNFDTLPLTNLSTVDWSDPEVGRRLLAYFLDINTDQASRRPELCKTIVEWIESVAGPLSQHKVLDLFSGTGSLALELASRGVKEYCGVDINSTLIAAAKNYEISKATYYCSDASKYVADNDLRKFSVVLVLYECLNSIGKNAATRLLRQLQVQCATDTWVFGDIRAIAHFQGVKYEIANECPFIDKLSSEITIREYGYTSNQKFFGSRYVSLRGNPSKYSTTHSFLELYNPSEFEEITNECRLKLYRTEKLLHGMKTDLPECAGNIFFAANTVGR